MAPRGGPSGSKGDLKGVPGGLGGRIVATLGEFGEGSEK